MIPIRLALAGLPTTYLGIKRGSCPDSVARKSFSSFSSCGRGGEKREKRVYSQLNYI